MALFEWNASYSVGVASCDRDHQRLFSLINELHEAMRAGKGNHVVADVVAELEKYTRSHFAAEEGLMLRTNYPGLAEHKAEHASFVSKIADIRKEMAEGNLRQAVPVYTFLNEWLSHHIREIDHKYSSHLNGAGIH